MREVIAAVVSLLVVIGAFSLQIEYTKGQTQEKMGHLIVTLSKACGK
jgi:hypothetical protein